MKQNSNWPESCPFVCLALPFSLSFGPWTARQLGAAPGDNAPPPPPPSQCASMNSSYAMTCLCGQWVANCLKGALEGLTRSPDPAPLPEGRPTLSLLTFKDLRIEASILPHVG